MLIQFRRTGTNFPLPNSGVRGIVRVNICLNSALLLESINTFLENENKLSSVLIC